MQSDDDKQTDLQLIAAINGGDQQAFAVLYHRYKDWVVGLAFRFTGHRDDALDVLQETFAYVVRKFPGFELTAQMTTFLYPAVRNLSIAARKKRMRATSGDENLDVFPKAEERDSSQRDDFTDMLAALSDAHREILLMRFVDDLTQPEIAAALDLPLGTVKSRLHHAVAAVRNSPMVAALLPHES
ncbi:MAG: RNA polymerase sigma factor [Fuerstiella sp.]